MPLAFSTLGCPGDTLAQLIGTALAAGATGLELRAADGEFVHPAMTASGRADVRAALADAGLEVLALASYVKVCDPDGAVDAELASAVDLAADIGAANVRVFPGAGLAPHRAGTPLPDVLAAADSLGARRLTDASAHARARGVTLALETHDSHPRGADIRRILELLPDGAPVRVIWDLMHPWRHDEAPERTAELLAGRLAYAQFKDGVRIPGTNEVTLTLPGNGALPLRQMQSLAAGVSASQGEIDPWVSLEWERAWHPELPPLADALTALKSVLA
ncbi:MAG: TIM barrel protein [Specibacter sp.]